LSANFHFQQLQPELLLDALESCGIRAESGLMPLNSYENRVYQFKAEDQRRYVVKFYRPERWTDDQIREEHQFCLELASHQINVVAPLQHHGDTLHHFQQYRFALFPSRGGRAFSAEQDEHWEQLGTLLGQLHQIGAGKAFQHRPQIQLVEELTHHSAKLLQCPLLPPSLLPAYQQSLEQLQQGCAALDTRLYQAKRIHGDCHSGNILTDHQLLLLDFDDCRQGPAVQDFWMLLSDDTIEQRIQLEILLEQYQNFTNFQQSELTLIEALRSRRLVLYMNWLAERWADPAFVQNFPWFATPDYWQQQLSVLRQQVQRLAQEPVRLHPFDW
jgi:Ser/Thr protein kinase RdoA (MazF antagonist)